MPNKLWEEMNTDEKLEWLRVAVKSLADTGNRNNDRLDGRDRILSDRISAVEAGIRTFQAEASETVEPSDE